MISWYIFQNISVSICAKPFWLSIDSEQFVRRGSATPKLLESLGLRHLGMSMSMSWPWVQLWMSAIDADEVQCLYLWSPQHYYGSQAGDQAPSQAWKPRSCKLLTLWSFVTICRAGAEWYPKGCASIPANSNLIFMHLPSKLMRDCFSFPVVVNLMNLFIFWVALDDESFLLEYHVVQAWHLLPFAQLNQGERGRPILSISVNMSLYACDVLGGRLKIRRSLAECFLRKGLQNSWHEGCPSIPWSPSLRTCDCAQVSPARPSRLSKAPWHVIVEVMTHLRWIDGSNGCHILVFGLDFNPMIHPIQWYWCCMSIAWYRRWTWSWGAKRYLFRDFDKPWQTLDV